MIDLSDLLTVCYTAAGVVAAASVAGLATVRRPARRSLATPMCVVIAVTVVTSLAGVRRRPPVPGDDARRGRLTVPGHAPPGRGVRPSTRGQPLPASGWPLAR
jgi:hypothetical protein